MITAVFNREFLNQLVTLKFLIMLLLVVVLSITAVLVMSEDYRLRANNYNVLQPKSDETIALKAPAVGSVLVKGLDEQMGRSMNIWMLGLIDVGSSQGGVNRLYELFSQLDLRLLIATILSLAALLFSFDMINGEKRDGTLKLVLTTRISRAQILTGKWLAGVAAVGISLVLSMLLAVLIVTITIPAAAAASFYTTAGLLTLSGLLYVATFIGLGLLISSLTSRPAISLVYAVLLWALLVFVIPNAAAQLSRTFGGDTGVALDEMRTREAWTKSIFENNQLPGEERNFQQMANTAATRLSNIYQEHINREQRQADLLSLLGLLSPVGPFNYLAWGSAGTGPYDAIEYKRQVLQYQSEAYRDALDAFIAAQNENGEQVSVATFSWQPRSIGTFFATEGLFSLGWLIVLNAGLFLAALISFNRFDVR